MVHKVKSPVEETRKSISDVPNKMCEGTFLDSPDRRAVQTNPHFTLIQHEQYHLPRQSSNSRSAHCVPHTKQGWQESTAMTKTHRANGMVSEAVARRRVGEAMVLETIKRRGTGHLKKRRVSSKDHVLRHRLVPSRSSRWVGSEGARECVPVETDAQSRPSSGDSKDGERRTETSYL